MDYVLLMDPGINVAFQSFSPQITSFFTEGEFLDSMPWYLLIISLISFGLHPRYGVRLATLFGINVGLNEAVKLACHLPRPYWISAAVKAFSAHSSFGFPSGAAMSGMVIYGYIAFVVRRYWIIFICCILLIVASLVRIFSGIHFLLDILGGWFIGLLLLAIFLLAAPKAEKFAAQLSRPARLFLFVVVAAIPILLVVPAYLSLGDWQVPGAWIELARQQTGAVIHPVRIQYAMGASGIILGSLFGYEFLSSRGGWMPPAELKRRAGVVVTGTLSVLLLNMALPGVWVTLGITVMSPMLVPFLNMAGVTFWLVGCVPYLAAKTGFSGPDP
ncbi:MAG: phosphatase PAP2 family protein [Methanoregula sp.]|nr:phosphatase PAP2 family protein [Methanoregula sp.]